MKCVTLLAALWQFYTSSDELHTLPLTARTQPEPWFEYWGVYRSSIQIQACSLMNTKRQFNVLFDRLPALAVHARAMAWWNDRTVGSVEMKVNTEERDWPVIVCFAVVWFFARINQKISGYEFWTKRYTFLHQDRLPKWKSWGCFLIPGLHLNIWLGLLLSWNIKDNGFVDLYSSNAGPNRKVVRLNEFFINSHSIYCFKNLFQMVQKAKQM